MRYICVDKSLLREWGKSTCIAYVSYDMCHSRATGPTDVYQRPLIVFVIRWCGNIGAPHKSNGVFYTVDLVDGTWNQKCYDPCCRDYRSSTMPLSRDVWESCTAWLGQHQR